MPTFLGLFSLAIEPLAIFLCQDPRAKGILTGPLQEKISLYADDSLLYLQDQGSSLRSVLEIIQLFCYYSGICINWIKSVFFSLHHSGLAGGDTYAVAVGGGVHLSGCVRVGGRLVAYLEDNIYLLLSQFACKCQAWQDLPFTPVGRLNLKTRLYLPKFLQKHSNIHTKEFFAKLDSLIVLFV